MFDEAVSATIRCAVDTIAPASPSMPAASTLGVHERVMDLIERSRPGAVPLLAAVLDAYAAQIRAGSTFIQLDDDQRGQVFVEMAASGVTDIRDGVDALFVFCWATLFTEHNPPGEASTGYHGPSLGVADFK